MKLLKAFSIALLVTAISGCSTTYIPSAGTADAKKIHDLPAETRVALLNVQPETGPVLLGEAGAKVYGDLHVWTDRLILSLKDTLKKKHVVVDDQASKVLKIAIEKAGIKTKAGGWAVDCSLEWKVQPGNGAMIPMAVVTGHWKYQDASNVGVRNACLMILQDEQVQSYLRGR